MSARAKFLFDDDFGAGEQVQKKAEPTILLAVHEAALAAAEAKAYRNGYSAGEAKATADAEQRAAKALERVAAGIETLAKGLSAISGKLEAEAVEVAFAVARKLAPELIAREP